MNLGKILISDCNAFQQGRCYTRWPLPQQVPMRLRDLEIGYLAIGWIGKRGRELNLSRGLGPRSGAGNRESLPGFPATVPEDVGRSLVRLGCQPDFNGR